MDFNSRTSCEVRHSVIIIMEKMVMHFNSRTSCEVRPISRRLINDCVISTHAPLARCDIFFAALRAYPVDFNSRTSCEVRHILTLIFQDFT